MATLTISIPKKLKQQMDKYPEINWSEVLKTRLQKRADALVKFEQKRQKGEL